LRAPPTETRVAACVCFRHEVVPAKPAPQRHMPLPGVVWRVDLGDLQ
jgi:hypothetical protein